MIKITTPLYINMNTKDGPKNFYLNMNNYRNWHYQISNKIKKFFKQMMEIELSDISIGKIESMEYKLYYPDKRRRDKMNAIAVIDKFFMDALVENGCIEDDNDKFVGEVIIKVPGTDKDNPRCEITIKSIDIV